MAEPDAGLPAATANQPTQRTRRHWTVALGGFFVMIGGSVPLSGLSFFHPYVIAELFPQRQSTYLWYYTLMLIGIVVSMMFIGRALLTRWGPKPLMYVGSVIAAAGLVLFSFAGSVLAFYAAGIVLGIGCGLSFQLVPIIWVNNWFARRKGTALGVVMGGTGLGGAMWSFLIPMISASAGWRTAYLVTAAVVLVVPPLATLLLIVDKPADVGLLPLGATGAEARAAAAEDPSRLPGLTYAEAVRSPWVWVVFAAILALGVVHGAAQILAVYLQGHTVYADPTIPLRRQPAEQTAFFSALMTTWTIGLIVFKPLLGWLNDKVGMLLAMLLTLGAQSLTFLWLPHMVYGSPVALMFVAMVFMAAGMSNGTVQPPLLVAGAVGPRDFGRIWSLLGTAYLLGMAFGAPLWGLVRDVTGSYVPGFYVAPVVLIGLTVVAVVAMRRAAAAQPPPPVPAEPAEPADGPVEKEQTS